MKKIFSLIIFVMTLFMVSCIDLDPGVVFKVTSEYAYTIGDDTPLYLDGIIATDADGEDLIESVKYDDSLVNYELTGTYTIYFELTMASKSKKISGIVRVSRSGLEEDVSLNIYYLNDLHGAILNDHNQMGLARIGNLIMDEKTKNPDTTLFITGGDILQGQLISNWYDGASTIELLNDLSLDAFVVGNHEFDWGIDVVTQYFDGSNDLQSNFPLLGANVYEKSTNELAPTFKPYTIIEKSGLKIAIIGTIGTGLESSIAYARIKDHKFIDPIERTSYFAQQARTQDGADIVLAINHGDDDWYNTSVANFTGDAKVDAIFNGHTHRYYTKDINNTPIIQSGANGSHVGHVTLNYSTIQGVYSYNHKNLNEAAEPRLRSEYASISQKTDTFYNEIKGLYDTIMTSGESVVRDTLAVYIGQLMQAKYGADVGVHNFGGTRDTISVGDSLSYAKLHAISPFDNSVVLVDVMGRELLNVIKGEAAYFRPGLSAESINPNSIYKMALNDYIFGGNANLRQKEANFTGMTVLDIFVESMENQSNVFDKWTRALPLMFNDNLSLFTHLFTQYPQLSI